jgi:hypothetical protein
MMNYRNFEIENSNLGVVNGTRSTDSYFTWNKSSVP